MDIGIDSYSYHKFFGEVFSTEEPPQKKMTLEDFLKKAAQLKVDGVSLETCFFSSFKKDYLKGIREIIDKNRFKVVVAWGHPDGFEGGRNKIAFKEMIDQFQTCRIFGTDVLRIVGSSLSFRHEPHMPQIKRLTKIFKEAVKIAQDHGVRLAMENHFDFTIEEIMTLISNVDSPYFGVTFDTGNCLRNGDDPVKSAALLAKHVYATHIKDLKVLYGADPNDWMFFSCTPIGDGIIDIPKIIQELSHGGYKGIYAVEIDNLHPDYHGEVDQAVSKSIDYLKGLKERFEEKGGLS